MLANAAKTQTAVMDALVLCRDRKTVEMLSPLLESTGSRTEVCGSADLAVEMLARWKFDAMFVDCDEIPEGADVLRALRAAPSSRSAVAFAIVDRAAARTAFQLGATFVLEKPVDSQRTRSALRAAYGLMLLARRRYYRRPISMSATLVRGSGERLLVRTVNLSEGGAGLQIGMPLEVAEGGELLFTLPGCGVEIAARSEVVWCADGRAGLRFLDLGRNGADQLREWIKESFEQEIRVAMKGRAFSC